VKAIFLDRVEALRQIRAVAREALTAFPEIQEVRLFGSLATGTQTGASDVDLFLLLDKPLSHPVEGLKPYFLFFSKRLNVALDILAGGPGLPAELERALRGSILLASRLETAA
jgi:predicted nucleotidyltransferase